MQNFDDGQPIDVITHDALITAWRLLERRLCATPGETFERAGLAIEVINGTAAFSAESQERLDAVLRVLADVALGQLGAVAELTLGGGSTADQRQEWMRGLIKERIDEQTIDAHETDLGG